MIRLVLFDLDGTLLDTAPELAYAMNVVRSEHGLAPLPLSTYISHIGKGMKAFAQAVLPESRENELDQWYKRVKEVYSHCWQRTKPFPGVAEMLTELTSKHIAVAVDSNKEAQFTEQMVATLLSQWKFATVLGRSDVLAPKPDPAGALHIAQQLQIPITNTLYVGDSVFDQETAHNAGMQFALAGWGYGNTASTTAITVLNSPIDLLGTL